MNKKIKKLRKYLEINNQENEKYLEELREEYFKIFDDSGEVKRVITALENSKEITNESCWPHWPASYIHTRNFSLFTGERDNLEFSFLKEYLEENFYIYFENEGDEKGEILILSHGPGIIIFCEGEVYDQEAEKTILTENDYSSEKERNEMIEKYMESTGCFPSVYKADYYGCVVSYINTRSEK
jgi:hypothetical protein